MIYKIFILCFCVIDLAFSATEYAPIVQLDSGQVRGLVLELRDKTHVYLYEGIRYGHAKRFEKPKFADPWKGIYNATERRDACPQRGKHVRKTESSFADVMVSSSTDTMSEDCLYLNVWRTKKLHQTHVPVMVWFYGGGFTTGTIFDDEYDARYIAKIGEVIVVTVNYRLGPFGFLYSGLEEAPGNQGLYDQILALKWVQANIQKFGGDPAQVTAFGQSAGSISLGALILSPLAKGLFHRAILQSGSPNMYRHTSSKENSLKKTISFAKRLNCYHTDMKKILECLRSKSIEELLNANSGSLFAGESLILMWGTEVMPVSPVEALKTKQFNRVGLMFGVNRNEGSGFVLGLFPEMNHSNITLSYVKKTIKTLVSDVFKEPYGDEVVEFYTKNLNGSNRDELRLAISDVFGDYHFVCPVEFFGEYFSRGLIHSTHSYRLMLPLHSGPHAGNQWQGVLHHQDVVYLFIIQNNPSKYTKDEVQLSTDMITAWTRFAREGNPTSMGHTQWTEAIDKKSSDSSVSFMSLDPKNYHIVSNYFRHKCDEFWRPKLLN